jgi:hypothetical protein
MSNFLNNLVARTLNLAPVVQPRITSRFEPVTPVDQSVEVHTPPAEPAVTTKIIESRITEPAPVPVVVPPPQIEHERVINTIRNTHVESKHEVVQVPVPVVERIQERVHTETRINTEKSTDSRLEIRENRIIEPAPAPKAPDPRNPRSETVVEPAPVTITKEVPQLIVPRVVEQAPVAPVQRFEILPAPQVEPTETINVTIGRVDVRAVFSAQAPKVPARPSTVNSLDDYLKQRSEGRR